MIFWQRWFQTLSRGLVRSRYMHALFLESGCIHNSSLQFPECWGASRFSVSWGEHCVFVPFLHDMAASIATSFLLSPRVLDGFFVFSIFRRNEINKRLSIFERSRVWASRLPTLPFPSSELHLTAFSSGRAFSSGTKTYEGFSSVSLWLRNWSRRARLYFLSTITSVAETARVSSWTLSSRFSLRAFSHFPLNADGSFLTLDHCSCSNPFAPSFEVARPYHLINLSCHWGLQSGMARLFVVSKILLFTQSQYSLKLNRISYVAKLTFFLSVCSSRITSFLLLTLFNGQAGIVSSFFHSLSTAAFASGIFIAWGIGINCHPMISCAWNVVFMIFR